MVQFMVKANALRWKLCARPPHYGISKWGHQAPMQCVTHMFLKWVIKLNKCATGCWYLQLWMNHAILCHHSDLKIMMFNGILFPRTNIGRIPRFLRVYSNKCQFFPDSLEHKIQILKWHFYLKKMLHSGLWK
jgi:hypothetical protein